MLTTGCVTDNADTAEDSTNISLVTENDTALYTQILINYQQIAEERLSDTFESNYNSNAKLVSKSSPNKELSYEWHCMIIESVSGLSKPTISSFRYAFVDINGDSIKEMLWFREDYVLLAVYTLINEEPLLLDAFWPRHKASISSSGSICTYDSGGAKDYTYTTRVLTDNSSILITEEMFGSEDGLFYENVDGNEVTISKERFEFLLESYNNASLKLETYLHINNINIFSLKD